jgi:hypothetical protein
MKIQTWEGSIVILEKRDKLGFNFNQLRDIIKISWVNKVPSLTNLALVKFASWTMEISRQNLHWLLFGRISYEILRKVEKFRNWVIN